MTMLPPTQSRVSIGVPTLHEDGVTLLCKYTNVTTGKAITVPVESAEPEDLEAAKRKIWGDLWRMN